MNFRYLYVDPATVVAVAKVAYNLWQSSQEARIKKQTIKLLKQMNKKIDLVIQKQNEILNELKSLKVFFKEEFRVQFLREVEIGMISIRSSLDVVSDLIIVDRKEALERIKELELPTRTFCFNLLERGSAAFTISFAGAVVHLTVLNLMRELGTKERVIRTLELGFLDKWEERFLLWFDVDNPEGLLLPLRLLGEVRESLQGQIDAHPRNIGLGAIDTGTQVYHGRRTCEIHRDRTLVITGDIKSGFADFYQDGSPYESKVCYSEPRDHFGPAAGAVPEMLFKSYDVKNPLSLHFPDNFDAEGLLGDDSFSYYNNASKIAFGTETTLNVPVNHPITQALNRLRDQWIAAVADETAFAAFLKVVQDTRQQLAARASDLRQGV